MVEQGPRLLVICGPSRSGKSTLLKRLFDELSQKFGLSVSHTTRTPRPGEENGDRYHFVSVEEMQAAIERGDFLEHTTFSGNMYGTSKQSIRNIQVLGKVCVLDIDIEGVKQIRNSDLNPILIFINPLSLAELEQCLRNRESEMTESWEKRLNTAKIEMEYGNVPGNFHIVVNNYNLRKAYQELKDFVLKKLETQHDEDSSTNAMVIEDAPKRRRRLQKRHLDSTSSKKTNKRRRNSDSNSEDLIFDKSMQEFKKKKQEKWQIMKNKIDNLENNSKIANGRIQKLEEEKKIADEKIRKLIQKLEEEKKIADEKIRKLIQKLEEEKKIAEEKIRKLEEDLKHLMNMLGLPKHPPEEYPVDEDTINYDDVPPTPESSTKDDGEPEQPRFKCIRCNELKYPNVYCNDCIREDMTDSIKNSLKNSLDRLVPENN